ncbi:hypothetical protein K378_00476 [Streptomyces sp. Amel2xB2]|uniref:hypothetical protein n=1 Tax=Streptomyces sp. Amel2xB2 TaxID=1305829 RepID=UPI000DBAA437|nr:hypothetical protein [Streptomyces sp. Amel2xB2]RAJ71656.1 hypothetical protein K378_00476 [Streptomyces sp. Amel2xB2]
MTLTSPAQTAAAQVLPLAKDLDENKVTPGVLGFIVFAVMGVALWMLMKSMHRHMDKVDFEEDPRAGDPAERAGADGGEGRTNDDSAASASPGATPGSSSTASGSGTGSRPGA